MTSFFCYLDVLFFTLIFVIHHFLSTTTGIDDLRIAVYDAAFSMLKVKRKGSDEVRVILSSDIFIFFLYISCILLCLFFVIKYLQFTIINFMLIIFNNLFRSGSDCLYLLGISLLIVIVYQLV